MFLNFVKTDDLTDIEYPSKDRTGLSYCFKTSLNNKNLQIHNICQLSSMFQVLEIHNDHERKLSNSSKI